MESDAKPKPEIIVIRQGFLESAGSDAVTFGLLMALPWFNYNFCGGSAWINAAIAFAWFIGVSSRVAGMMKKNTKTPDEARAWLAENYPENPA